MKWNPTNAPVEREGSQTPKQVLLQCETFGVLRKRLFDQLHKAIGPKELSNYDIVVSNPLATRYVAQFMHRTGLLAQFQHTEQEESDDETEDLDLEVIVQSPEDDGHYPMLATTVEGEENLDSLLEYTVPDRADALNGRKNITPNRGRSEDVGELGLILLQQELAGSLIKRCSHV